MFLAAVKLAPALAMGNTVIIKASEVAPAPLFELAKLIDKVGLPKGVINILSGFGEDCGKVLTSHPKIDRIAFTGGVHTAKHIVRNSAENLSQVTLELGGKSPVAVFKDANIDSKGLENNPKCLLIIKKNEKIPRNEKCPATGKKYKHCCGAL